jgi:Putative beta-barrel porin 2
MSGSRQPMIRASSHGMRNGVLRLALSALFLIIGYINVSRAQEPPLDVPIRGSLGAKPGAAIPIEGWLLYPSIRMYTAYSDNLFNSSQTPISAWGFGLSPSMSAEWSNGIHTTTLNASVDREVYPTDNEANRLDWNGGFTQKYEALRDLSFRLNGNVAHASVANGLQNSIPTPINAPQTTVLPDGNTLLPNGVILSPTGVPVGQQAPASPTVNGRSSISPHDAFTGTLSIDKIFNHGILSVSGAAARTVYETDSSQDSTSKTFTEQAGVWLGPLFYAFSNGSIATTSIATSGPTTAYQIIGGLGTRQFGLFRASANFGHQGSWGGGSTAGGNVFGGSLTYFPTPVWTISASFNGTINVASQSTPSQLALNLPAQVPVQISLGTSTRVASTTLSSSYTLSPQWSTSENVSYSRIQNAGTTSPDIAWSAGATLNYNMRHNLALSWQYQYTTLLSSTPFSSTKQNLVTMSANYNF